MYAIINDRSKQYTVKTGDRILIDSRQGVKAGDEIIFDKVLFLGGKKGESKVGSPAIAGAKVIGKVEHEVEKGEKVYIWKWQRREQYQRRVGHRQKHTSVRITDIKV